MDKNLPPKLDRKTLRQLAIEQLVEIVMEQALAIEALKTRVIELEIVIEKLKVSRDWEQREKVRSGFGSQLHPYILNKIWFFSCDRILKQAIYVPGFSTSQNRVAPVEI